MSTARVQQFQPTTTAKPFVKWVGGKRRLVPDLLLRIPREFGTYHEPFVGGGALFFELQPEAAVLTDVNRRLVRTWRAVQQEVERVIDLLAVYEARHDTEFFYAQRALDIDARSDVEVAAWFIYLNKTAYNGLYRVNKRDGFNVPIGRYARPNICDAEGLRASSDALRDVTLEVADYTRVLERAVAGDLVYFDPPYVPVSASSSFTAYASGGFTMDDQARLRDVALALKQRGVHVLLSNSWTKEVRDLYGEGFTVHRVSAPRAVNSKAELRGKVFEALVF